MIRPLGGYYQDENVIAGKIENTGCYVKKTSNHFSSSFNRFIIFGELDTAPSNWTNQANKQWITLNFPYKLSEVCNVTQLHSKLSENHCRGIL